MLEGGQVCTNAYPYILKWNYPPGLLIRGELKVVEAVIVEDKPSPLPALIPPSLLPQPALLVWRMRM